MFAVLCASGKGHFFLFLFSDGVLVGLAAGERFKSGRRVVIFFTVGLFELSVLFCFLLLEHFCDFEEELVDSLAGLGGDGVIGHLVLLDQLLQLLLLEISE